MLTRHHATGYQGYGRDRLAASANHAAAEAHVSEARREAPNVEVATKQTWATRQGNLYPANSYRARAGDKLVFRQYQSAGASGGLAIYTSNGAYVDGSVTDQDGDSVVFDGVTRQWHQRIVDLSSVATAGLSVLAIGCAAEGTTAPGRFDEWFADMAILSADGTVTPVFHRQPSIGLGYFGDPGVTNVGVEVDTYGVPGGATPGQNLVTYTLGDHLGSASQEFVAGGWPVWGGQFMPYGGEIGTQGTTDNHYKFTGKERDLESGLDYFGARYYASSMGRWMSPDWSAKEDPVPYAKLDNPQSLNLYGYVLNNPLGTADADGHSGCPPDCSTGNNVVDFVVGALNAFSSDNLAGAGRANQSSAGGQLGQTLGDSAALVTGTAEVVLGAVGEIAGTGISLTGVGALVGVPVDVLSAGAIAHGATTDAVAGGHIVAMGLGSYTNTHESGKTYSGKGDSGRASDSAKRVEGETGDKHVSTDHKTADSDRQSFKDEHQRIQQNGGAGSDKNHNKIESPGKKYSKQDGSN